jgi:hypothetical protein
MIGNYCTRSKGDTLAGFDCGARIGVPSSPPDAMYSVEENAVMKAEFSKPRNPFGVRDAPAPDGADVSDFAAEVTLSGDAADPNAAAWGAPPGAEGLGIEGEWSSRWNGGVDPTIAGDTAASWKLGKAQLRSLGDRVYLLFDWDEGARRALIDARRSGPNRLQGRYINLSDPTITRPWVGLIVDHRRIDGRWTNGRLDFRR